MRLAPDKVYEQFGINDEQRYLADLKIRQLLGGIQDVIIQLDGSFAYVRHMLEEQGIGVERIENTSESVIVNLKK